MIDVVMCLRNPDIRVLDLVVRRIRQQPEVRRILFVVSRKGDLDPFVAWANPNLVHNDAIIYEDRSLSFARKEGIRASSTELISFVDCDVVIPSNYYQKCLYYLNRFPFVGAVNGQSIDTEWERWGHHPEKRHIRILQRGLCTANVIRRDLLRDWNPPSKLEALEDFHMTQHLADQGKLWLQIPHYVLHLSFGEDMRKRWLWNAAGTRMIKELGLGDKMQFGWQATSNLQYLLMRLFRLLALPVTYKRYGRNARLILFELNRQWYTLKGYFQYDRYLETRRTGYERRQMG